MWPHIPGEVPSAPQLEEPPIINDGSLLVLVSEQYDRLLDEEDERRRAVDARLIPFLPLTAVMATVLAASVPIALTGNLEDLNEVELTVVLVPLLYVAAQLIFCLFAAVAGLSRRGYLSPKVDELEPLDGEAVDAYKNRLLRVKRACVAQNRWATNAKVDQMAITHRALQSAVVGVAVLIVAASALAVGRAGESPKSRASDTIATASPAISVSPSPTVSAMSPSAPPTSAPIASPNP